MTRLLIKILLFIFLGTVSYSEIINKIEVSGNIRLSPKTIINFSELSVEENITQEKLNDSIKKLYKTNFFENVSFSLINQTLLISVIENPVVQEIKINGVKAEKFSEIIKKSIFTKEKNPFNKNRIQDDVRIIANLFKNTGYYFVSIDPEIEENNNNTINVIYNIDQGEKATIDTIKFIGDKKFKDRKLFSIIVSEENKPWKFLSKKKYINEETVNLDKRLLTNFYLQKGYYDIKINDAYSQLVDKNKFVITFNIDSGNKYFFGDFKLNLPNDFDKKKFIKLDKIFEDLKDQTYNISEIEGIINEIENISLQENYEFINADIVENKTNNRIDFEINIKETENIYISRINILGNNITSEEFIRDQLIVDEGDPFNKILYNKTINNIRSTGIFKSVLSEIKKDDTNQNIIDIIVEEKPTGEISAGAGYGSDGSSFSFGIRENNFNGQGIELETNLSLSEDSIKGLFSYSHPNFRYSDRALTTSLQSTSTDKLSDFGYKSSLNQFSLGTRYEQFQNTFFSPILSISSEKIEVTSSASTAYKKQKGSYFDTVFGYDLTYDKRNSRYQPTKGYFSQWSQNLPVISDDSSIYNSYQFTHYQEPFDNMVISTGILARAINSLESDGDVRVSKRLYVPATRLRGFKSGNVGPKDGSDYVGGNYMSTFNISSTVPYILDNAESLDVKVFLDTANIWGVDYSNSINDSNKLRSSTGIALDILTPVGPLSFSYAEAITKASTDKTESFKFQLGTTF